MKDMKRILRDQKGFTLIEIISVLVILGILAAVAIPKYMDLQSDAQKSAAQAAIGAAASNVTMAYAKCLLSGSTPTAVSAAGVITGCSTTIATSVGDFTAIYGGDYSAATGVTVTLTAGSPTWLTAATITAAGGPKTLLFQ